MATGAMTEPCPLLPRCGFFRNVQRSSDAVVRAWVRVFCESAAKAEECARKRFRDTRGCDPPDTMAPTGRLL